jgi:hypothetical protein
MNDDGKRGIEGGGSSSSPGRGCSAPTIYEEVSSLIMSNKRQEVRTGVEDRRRPRATPVDPGVECRGKPSPYYIRAGEGDASFIVGTSPCGCPGEVGGG